VSETFNGKLLPKPEWLEIAQQPPSLFRIVPSLTPYNLLFPKMGVPNAPPMTNFATEALAGKLTAFRRR